MSWLDEIPMKIHLGLDEEVRKQVEFMTASEIIVPDYRKILQETKYVFSLENWVLTGVQDGYGAPNIQFCNAASCPPYWMLFRSPQQSRLASRWCSNFWESNILCCSRSLNETHFHTGNDKVMFNISNSDDDDDDSSDNEKGLTRTNWHRSGRQELEMNDLHSGSSSRLNLSSCCGVSLQQDSHILQCSLINLKAQEKNLWKIQNHKDSFFEHSESHITSITQSSDLLTIMPLAPTWPLDSRVTVYDSSVELLSALSPEEQQLLEAVMAHGYPLRTAINALQKTGYQNPEQILSYLVAFDHLCGLGYDESQVEEALEIFQNCETKAKEFLHLLTQFHEMGFQQNVIKEVLLMHGNQRDDALEELMMHGS